jgi:outer membrane protein assembly factor BamB
MYCGDGSGSRCMMAIDPEKQTPTKTWELKKETPYVPCLLVKGDRLFWIGDKGIATCAEAKTGKIVWAERVFAADVSASPVMVGDKILLVSEKGEVAVLKADKEFEDPVKVSLGEGVFASPAIADGKVFIRGNTHLFCFGKKYRFFGAGIVSDGFTSVAYASGPERYRPRNSFALRAVFTAS